MKYDERNPIVSVRVPKAILESVEALIEEANNSDYYNTQITLAVFVRQALLLRFNALKKDMKLMAKERDKQAPPPQSD